MKLILKHPLLLRYWNRSFAIAEEPILLLSLPRSGSSWLGEVLAQQDDVRYLREPITSVYMTILSKGVSFFMPNSCKYHALYQTAADNAFNAKLNYPNSVVYKGSDWYDLKNKKKLLIKEVNPLFLHDFMCRFKPKVIYLERCVYATAKSFMALGWKGDDLFSERFDPITLEKILSVKADLLTQDFYFQMGFLQGVILAINEPHFSSNNILRVSYEDIIANPKVEVAKITAFLNYGNTAQVQQYIEESLSSQDSYQVGTFSTKRNSKQLQEKQKQERLEPNYEKTIQAYNLGYTGFKAKMQS
ncbi:sulfotransferase [Pseudoalteromonas shioyasakiensis]|uniref:sulfotransferase domain-containing protein n=1 Tax=Pseudoalteromonas shioyasakiensis TaxID=1190813 RepID=UPI0021195D93|nr:sulfotransferase domain-containing protein [Pseudoalteromonas shioyasakiensis]MCQ8879466.1 sulfotransferase [Pseudoalteromonas shioyasakiensis]